jgi:hypothetical protein
LKLSIKGLSVDSENARSSFFDAVAAFHDFTDILLLQLGQSNRLLRFIEE